MKHQCRSPFRHPECTRARRCRGVFVRRSWHASLAFLSRYPVYLGEDDKSLIVEHGDLSGSTGLKPGRTIR